MKKCNHEESSVVFLQIINADSEGIVALFSDTCNRCGKLLGKETRYFMCYDVKEEEV